MAFTAIPAGDVDAESPGSDALFALIKSNQDHIYSMLTDGASALEVLDIDTITVSGTGTALTVVNNSQFDGNVNIDGQLTTGSFFVSDFLQDFERWA